MKRSLLNYQVFRVVYSMRRLIACAVFFLIFFEGGRAHSFVVVKQAGTLGTLLTQVQQDTCTALAIKGKLNSFPMASMCLLVVIGLFVVLSLPGTS